MTARTLIVPRPDLPDAAFDVMKAGFPHETHEMFRRFWGAYPDAVHALVYDGDMLVAHAGYVMRTLYIDATPYEVPYVEYVCAEPRRRGYGTLAMRALGDEIARRAFTLAALATGSPSFYERLGWRLWRGPTACRHPDGTSVPTPEAPMVLDLGASVDLDAPIQCAWREIGDVW